MNPSSASIPPISRRVARCLPWGVLMFLMGAGCGKRDQVPFDVLQEPVSIVATASIQEGPHRFRLRLSKGDDEWVVHSSVRRWTSGRRSSRPEIADALRSLVVWKDPYLFVREDNGDGNAWRANVDHVFKIAGGKVVPLGTVSARFGPPGSQLQDGRFLDIYDRLEFTFFTAHADAPGFDVVMEEKEGRWIVRLEETWQRGQARFTTCFSALEAAARDPGRVVTETDRRRIRAAALQCLALSRYCERDTEYEASLALARTSLGNLSELIEEVSTIVPGEPAPSRDEVLRANPALVNLFKESPRAADAEDPANRLNWRIPVPEALSPRP